jgi:drug/metabolite transporter (DMT)-like permease
MFIGAGMLWACYTVTVRKARLNGLHAAAIAAVISLLTYLPIYVGIFGLTLFEMPWQDLATQALVHGVLVAVVSFFLYGRAITLLGAQSGSAFTALSPAITAVLAIPILGEWPTLADGAAMLLISAGVYSASGGGLPGRPVKAGLSRATR